MKLYQVVLKDIRRRKKRMLYATLGVIIATMTVVGVLTIALAGQNKITGQMEKYGANLSIIPATKSLDTGLGNLILGTITVGDNYISADKLHQIREVTDGMIRHYLDGLPAGDIAAIAPQLFVQSEIKSTSVILVGIDLEQELNTKSWWHVSRGEYFRAGNQAVVGSMAAELLKINVGDIISVNNTDIKVTGILDETGSGDDYRVYVSLLFLQEISNKPGLISAVDIRALCNACPVDIIADAINTEISGVRAVAVKQVAATEMGMLDKIKRLMLALGGITLIVGTFGVVNTLMTSVHERIKDIGIMRAVGASRNQIIRVFIYEAFIIGVLGGLLGYAAGTILAFIIGPLIFAGAPVSVVPQYLPMAIGLAIIMATVSTLYPAYHATKIRVSDSFRSL